MKKLVILGAGESGMGAALLAHAQGLEVWVSDAGHISSPRRQALLDHGIAFEEDGHTWGCLQGACEVIKSPGIPEEAPIVQAARQAGIPIIDEIEFASRYTEAFLIGITGTNGKTTTTKLIYHLLKTAGLDVGMAGNVGNSFAKTLLKPHHKYYVLELSSFQLEGMHACRLNIACLLNITPDHLDRYQGQMELYIQAKFRILQNMMAQDHFVYNQDDPSTQAYMQGRQVTPHLHPISTHQPSAVPITALPQHLKGTHNQYNTLVATAVAQLLGIDMDIIQQGLTTFQGVPHRIEWVATINDVQFYNDSKATNVEAARAALSSFDSSIIWIAGGKDKGNDYTSLQLLVRARVKAMICLGADNQKLFQAFQPIVPQFAETQQPIEAVRMAMDCALPGDIVLFSPACASFDLFKNFEARGNAFKAAVMQLQNEKALQ